MSDTINKNRVFDANVVMFPSSKNFPPTVDSVDLHDDPLEALLNEFSDVLDDDQDEDLEAELEEIARENLELYKKQQNIQNMALMGEEDLKETVSKQLSYLNETNLRIKHLLKEIESYMPGKR
jgi:Lon protease-like protein